MQWLAASTLVGGLMAAGVAPASALPALAAPSSPPATCADVHAVNPTALDGTYTLINGGKVLTLYCYDMAGTPREFVNLVNTGTGTNFSQYTAGGPAVGTDARTTFSKLRIDPATLTVDIGDLTFATSTGSLGHGNSGTEVTSMPYGVAMSCAGGPDGLGNIDLRGTAFTVADTFDVNGSAGSSGSATPSSGNQVIDLTGGGSCGWITPDPPMYNPFNPQPGNFALNLADNAMVTSTTLGVTPASPAGVGTAEMLTATVTPTATGSVVFKDGTTALGGPVTVTSGMRR